MTVFTVLILCHFHNLASPFHKKAFVQGYRQGRFSYSRKFQYHMKHFMSYMLTQQADHSQERVAKFDNVGKSDSKFPSLLFPPVHFTRSNTDTFNTHNIVICNLIQKFSPYLEQPGYAIQKEIYTFIFSPLLWKLISSCLCVLVQLLSIPELCGDHSTCLNADMRIIKLLGIICDVSQGYII